ncbi:hypothetical protein [Polaromonas sp. YR568]|uniref:hypothetical protein n=1 Tax=Polaromonas sp. YR568 TaxID=1855301 RepID=UPI00313828C7
MATVAPNFAPILAAIDFSTTTVAVLACGVVLMGVFVTIFAVRQVLGMVRGQVYYGGRWWDKDDYFTALSEVKQKVRSGDLVDMESRRALFLFEGRTGRSSSNRIRTPRI